MRPACLQVKNDVGSKQRPGHNGFLGFELPVLSLAAVSLLISSLSSPLWDSVIYLRLPLCADRSAVLFINNPINTKYIMMCF